MERLHTDALDSAASATGFWIILQPKNFVENDVFWGSDVWCGINWRMFRRKQTASQIVFKRKLILYADI